MPDLRPINALFRQWPFGLDSWTNPATVSPQAYVWAQNILNKGGIPQTRPGSRSLACMPRGFAQGIKLFTPRSGVPHLIAAVTGKIYVAAAPFTEWRQLTNLSFSETSRFITITIALKSSDYNNSGELFYLENPYKVAVIQDGNTRAAYWDGATAAHINPRPTAKDQQTVDGRDGTKIGLWSVYSNNRLWVARGRFIFASDIGNPLKFKESQYINESPAFILPDDCTGMIEVTDQSGILCFYENGADFIETSLQDRTQWLDVGNIQRTVLEVGCVSPRSIIKHNGLVHWFSPKGWVSMNEALRANLDSSLDVLDDRMAYSKHNIGPDLSSICAGKMENIALLSVPFCSLYNTHTWVSDQAVAEDNRIQAWASVWTGWRPVEWTSGIVNGYERIFFLSADTDGHNRVWEGFLPDRKDNGCDITCSVQLRQEEFDNPDLLKRFKFAEIQLAQIAGTVDVMTAVASSRGWFDKLSTHEIVANYERVDYDTTYGDGVTKPLYASSRKQSRIFRTQEWNEPSACNKCGIESRILHNIDYGFSFFIGWSGRAALTRVKLFALEQTEEEDRGECPQDETGIRVVDGMGCSYNELNPLNMTNPFPRYIANVVLDGTDTLGRPISWESSAFSNISQLDADRRANCKAFQQLLLNAQNFVRIPQLAFYTEDGSTVLSSLEFGEIAYGESAELTVRIVNIGTATLDLDSAAITRATGVFSIVSGPERVSLEPDEFTFITLRATNQ